MEIVFGNFEQLVEDKITTSAMSIDAHKVRYHCALLSQIAMRMKAIKS